MDWMKDQNEIMELHVPKWLSRSLCVAVLLAVAMCIYTVTAYSRNKLSVQAMDSGERVIVLAKDQYNNKQQFTALLTIDDFMQEHPKNVEVALEGVRMSMKSGYYDVASYFLSEYLLDAGFTDDELNELDGYIDLLNRYYDTSDAIDSAYADLGLGEDASLFAPENATLLAGYKESLMTLANDPRYDKELFYYVYSALCTLDEEEEAISSYMIAADYLPVACDVDSGMARYERGKGNYASAMEWIEKGESINAEYPDLVRAKATILLAEGEYEEALTIAEKLYEEYPDTDYALDTYCVALYANDKSVDLAMMRKEAEKVGYEFDELFYSLLAGEISVRDYYTTGEDA